MRNRVVAGATMSRMQVLRHAAFVDPRGDGSGGNPAGLVLDETGELSAEQMQRIAAEVGYSETAFARALDHRESAVRYFSPLAEVPFCGHATIALALVLADRFGPGEWTLRTAIGEVRTHVAPTEAGPAATLVSVEPSVEPLARTPREELLDALRVDPAALDPALPLAVASAGARHPVVALSSRADLDALDYSMDALAPLMARQGWTTVQVVHRMAPDLFAARNPFPPGGIREDPATGSAAAALGGYLRRLGAAPASGRLEIRQGEHVGRPSLLIVDVPPSGGIAVTGYGAPIV